MFGRRKLLKGMLAGAALAPLTRVAPLRAQPGRAAPKLVVFASPNSWMVGWDGAGSAEGFGVSGLSEFGPTRQSVDLPSRLPAILQPLEPFADRLVLCDNLRGLTYVPREVSFAPVNAHRQAAYILTGHGVFNDEPAAASGGDGEWYSQGPSLDQLFASHYGCDVLGLAGRNDESNAGEGWISHIEANRAHQPFRNPTDAAATVFGVDTTDPAALAAVDRRRAILSVLGRDADAMRARLSVRDGARLREHAESIAAALGGLDDVTSRSCAATRPSYDYDETDYASVPRLMRDYADILATGLSCGVTQVGYMMPGNLGGHVRPHWPELGIDGSPSDHSWNHAFDGDFVRGDLGGYTQEQAWSQGVKLQQAYNSMFAYLLQRLEETPDIDGRPLLDNTIVLHVKQMRTNHNSSRLFTIVAGGQGLGVRGGRFIRFEGERRSGRPDTVDEGRWHNDLLVGVGQLLGLPVDSMGHPELNQNPVDLT